MMDAVHVILEGGGDVLFIKQLLMEIEPQLRGKWFKCPKGEAVDESQFQVPTLTLKAAWKGKLLILHAMNGVDHIFPMPEGMLNDLGCDVGEKNVVVTKNVFIVDADDSKRQNGSGGIASAKKKIQAEAAKCQALHIACAGFAMPDNQSDGTLESLLDAMIPQANRSFINCCWKGFIACSKGHGAICDPPLKSEIDIYAKLFNRKANKEMFASVSFKDPTVWDWNVSELDPLKTFLRREVLT